MQDYLKLLDKNAVFGEPCVLAIGIFDGLHLGHQRVIDSAKLLAKKYKAKPCVLTFSPHPSHIISMPKGKVEMLFNLEGRARAFHKIGIKNVFVKKFDKRFSSLTPLGFAKFLKKTFPNLKGIVTGFNFVFGKNATGNTQTLKELSEKFSWEYQSVCGLFKGRSRVSSTRLRDAIKKGDVKKYASLAGSPYSAFGVVCSGKKLGRTIGFPTLNLPWNPECRLPFGVYAVRLVHGKKIYNGIANYGTSPTFEPTPPTIETHLFKKVRFGAGSKITVEFLDFIRKEKKFNSIEALKKQILLDKGKALDKDSGP